MAVTVELGTLVSQCGPGSPCLGPYLPLLPETGSHFPCLLPEGPLAQLSFDMLLGTWELGSESAPSLSCMIQEPRGFPLRLLRHVGPGLTPRDTLLSAAFWGEMLTEPLLKLLSSEPLRRSGSADAGSCPGHIL